MGLSLLLTEQENCLSQTFNKKLEAHIDFPDDKKNIFTSFGYQWKAEKLYANITDELQYYDIGSNDATITDSLITFHC